MRAAAGRSTGLERAPTIQRDCGISRKVWQSKAKQVNNDGEDDDYCKVEQVIMVMIINMMIMIIL